MRGWFGFGIMAVLVCRVGPGRRSKKGAVFGDPGGRPGGMKRQRAILAVLALDRFQTNRKSKECLVAKTVFNRML